MELKICESVAMTRIILPELHPPNGDKRSVNENSVNLCVLSVSVVKNEVFVENVKFVEV
jgi:hypothetical protein